MTNSVMEHVECPFAKGNLTSDGIQWSTERDTTAAGVDVEVVHRDAVCDGFEGRQHVPVVELPAPTV